MGRVCSSSRLTYIFNYIALTLEVELLLGVLCLIHMSTGLIGFETCCLTSFIDKRLINAHVARCCCSIFRNMSQRVFLIQRARKAKVVHLIYQHEGLEETLVCLSTVL